MTDLKESLAKIKSCITNAGYSEYTPITFEGEEVALIRVPTSLELQRGMSLAGVSYEQDGLIDNVGYSITASIIALGGTINGVSFKRGNEGFKKCEDGSELVINHGNFDYLPAELVMSIIKEVMRIIVEFHESAKSLEKN